MCNAGAVGALAAVLGSSAEHGQAEANYEAQRKANALAFNRTKRLATDDLNLNFDAVRGRQAEVREDVESRVSTIIERAREAAGTATASAQASGVAGQSVGELINEIGQQQLDFIAAAERDVTRTDQQAARQGRAIRGQFEARTINALPASLAEPSFMAFLLGASSDAFAAYNSTKPEDT